jgi:hypothetical protein
MWHPVSSNNKLFLNLIRVKPTLKLSIVLTSRKNFIEVQRRNKILKNISKVSRFWSICSKKINKLNPTITQSVVNI